MRPCSDNRSETEQLLADKIPARVVGATLAVLTGPAAPFTSGAISSILEHILKRGNAKYVQSAEALLATAAEATHMELEQVCEWAKSAPERLELTTNAVRAALDTLDERKILALAKVFSYGLTDDAHIDICAMYIAAIRPLESAHIRILERLIETQADSPTGEPPNVVYEGEIIDSFPGLAPAMRPILSVLEREGLAYQTGFDGGTWTEPPRGQPYAVSDFGVQVHGWLSSRVAPVGNPAPRRDRG